MDAHFAHFRTVAVLMHAFPSFVPAFSGT